MALYCPYSVSASPAPLDRLEREGEPRCQKVTNISTRTNDI